MQLIGMLDSPFVRRVAIALRLLDLPYEHRPLSVFRNFQAFSLFNPMVKAPTLVLDDGTVLMDSSLILDYLECLAGRERSLLPQRPQARARALSLIGAALVACEKSVQIYYELNLRPEERRHGPWLERVEGGLRLAGGSAAPGAAGTRRWHRAGRGDRRGGLALQPTGGRGAGRRQRIPGTGKLFGLCGGVAGVPRYAAGLSPRGARLAPLERLDSACARPRFAVGRCRRHGPDRLLRTAVRRRPGGGPALAQPGPERGPRLALRHAAGRALVRLLDPPGGIATDPPAAGGLGAGELLRAQRPLELMGTAGTRSRTRGRRQWSEPDARR